MEFHDETKPLSLVTDASEVGLRAGLLQKRDVLSSHRHDVPNNNILRPIAFASKNLSATEKIQ